MASEEPNESPSALHISQTRSPLVFPLPQEVVDLIVDNVAALPSPANPYENLFTCHQVCRTFARRSRAILFSIVRIGFNPNAQITQIVNRLAEFADFLVGSASHPSILRHVMVFQLICPFGVTQGLLDLYANKYLLDILGILSSEGTRLQGISLSNFSNKGEPERLPSWTSLSEDFKRLLRKTVTLPQLHGFGLNSFKDVPWDLFSGSSIRYLDFGAVFAASAAPDNMLSLPAPALEVLRVFDARCKFPLEYALRRPTTPQHASLKTLYFPLFQSGDVSRLATIATSAAWSLTTLHIDIMTPYMGSSPKPICLQWFPNLVNLSLKFSRAFLDPAVFFRLFDLQTFLSGLPHPHDRRTTTYVRWIMIHLDFEPEFIQRNGNLRTLISPENLLSLLGDESRLGGRFRLWRDVDEILCGSRYGNLQQVGFDTGLKWTFLSPRGASESAPTQYVAVVETWMKAIATHAFPNLANSRRLWVH